MHPRRRPLRAFLQAWTASLVMAVTIVALPISTTAAVTPCTDPPEVVPQDRLTAGRTGTAWTAVEGRTPVPFDVEIIGVLEDGIAPGLDFILIETSGPVIDETGGIASGMSGSPVYINGKLAGAISYGFFAADQRIGGMTPAEPMVELFSYGTSARNPRIARRVAMTPTLRRAAARSSGTDASSFGQAELLPTPLAVSGAREGDLAAVADRMARDGARVIPYTSSSSRVPSRDTMATEPVAPGEPFAAALSYGLVTYAGIGTTTAVCGDLAIAFGHPFRFQGGGPTAGFSGAEILTVIPDPSNLYGPFKIGNIAELHGVVDQDRIHGIRGVEGEMPRGTAITSDITNLDTGKRRVDTTVVVVPSWTRWVVWDHMWYATLGVLNSRQGTVDVDWTISGVVDGEPFSVSHGNRFSGSISQPGYELYQVVRALRSQDVAQVRVTDVEITASVSETLVTASVGESLTASSVAPALRDRDRLQVVAGDTVQIRTPLDPRGPADPFDVDLSIGVPADVEGDGQLRVESGQSFLRYWNVDSFAQLLKRIQRLPRSDTLRASVKMEGARSVLVTVPLEYVPKRSWDRVRLRLQG